MAYPRSAAARGGKAPASPRQKAIARLTIRETEPWKRSTGAKSQFGKAIAGQNAMKYSIRWRFRAHEVSDFAATLLQVERLLEQFNEIADRYSFYQRDSRFSVLIKTKFAHGTDQRGEWASIALAIQTQASWRGSEDNPPSDLENFGLLCWQELNQLLDVGRSLLPAAKAG
ncbi:hypothetical protein H6F67_27175 [Microcoleus sp. FACHB-1515]|uniref:hypothetical protein n=1 Tax=Cyanophyceae TaxID=3028117 RepID=UPI0016899083|nr:hypothetical protein [Microcoleus sp. FACHB-1515]MBD2093521.1 hypothetical protein [Microcoleus sp. FACHB-1515]